MSEGMSHGVKNVESKGFACGQSLASGIDTFFIYNGLGVRGKETLGFWSRPFTEKGNPGRGPALGQ